MTHEIFMYSYPWMRFREWLNSVCAKFNLMVAILDRISAERLKQLSRSLLKQVSKSVPLLSRCPMKQHGVGRCHFDVVPYYLWKWYMSWFYDPWGSHSGGKSFCFLWNPWEKWGLPPASFLWGIPSLSTMIFLLILVYLTKWLTRGRLLKCCW